MGIMITVLLLLGVATILMYACLVKASSTYSRAGEEEALEMAAEKEFENKVKAFLKEQGCWYVKYWGGGGYTRAGVPDLLICCNGHFIGLELKAPTGRPSELQKVELRRIKEAGGLGILLYPEGFEKFKKLIIALKEGSNAYY